MNIINKTAVALALAGCSWIAVASPATADVKDFEFQLVQPEVKKGDGAIVTVRLVNKRTGKAVSDAVIVAKRIDMAPDAMAEMKVPSDQVPSATPGTYAFKADISMQGRWQLSLAAKVQGEIGTVQSKLVVKAIP